MCGWVLIPPPPCQGSKCGVGPGSRKSGKSDDDSQDSIAEDNISASLWAEDGWSYSQHAVDLMDDAWGVLGLFTPSSLSVVSSKSGKSNNGSEKNDKGSVE